MRRFVRTFFVKRRAQVTVLQDSGLRQFEVYRWRAEAPQGDGLERVTTFPYAEGGQDFVKEAAVSTARQIVGREAAVPGVQ